MKFPWVGRAEHEALYEYVLRLEDRITKLESKRTELELVKAPAKHESAGRFRWGTRRAAFEQESYRTANLAPDTMREITTRNAELAEKAKVSE